MTRLLNFDVVIIGASSSGLFLAKLLREAGLSVAVFERQVSLNPARRTYIITPKIRDVLGYVPDTGLLHKVNQIEVETKGAEASVRLQEPDLIIERNLLIRHLSVQAKEAGAALYLGHSFLGFVEENGKIFIGIETKDGQKIEVSSPTLVGADGAFSQVGKSVGIPQPPYTSLLQAEVKLPNGWDPAVTKVWFDKEKTGYFFWLIPESKTRGVVGLITEEKGNPRRLLDKFLDVHRFEAIAYQAGKAAMYDPGVEPYTEIKNIRVFLIGDAAGHVKVTTVGGSVSGFRGAAAVAESILTGKSYRTTNRPNEKELKLHWWLRQLLNRMTNKDYDQMVGLLSGQMGEFLGKHNRDDMAGKIWMMIRAQPRFIALGGKLALRILDGKH